MTENTVFDLAALKETMKTEGVVEITHPQTGVATGVKIRVASPDSERFISVDRRLKNRNMAIMQKSKNKTVTMEAVDAAAMDLLVGITLGWEGVTWSGAEMEFTEANVRTLYSEFPFIKEQVDSFVGDRGNFFVS